MNGHPSVPTVDLDFLRRWTPARLMLAGLMIYALLTLVSPLVYDLEPISLAGAIYALVSIGAFFAGCYGANFFISRSDPLEPLPFKASVDRYINATLVIAIISIAMRFYDRFVVRGFAVEETFLQTRETLNTNVSLFGYIAGPGFCFGLFSLALIWLSSGQKRRPVMFVLAVVLAAYPVAESLLQGSRSSMLHAGLLVFIFARATGAMKWLFRSKLAMTALLLMTLTLFRSLYEMRTLENSDYQETIFEVYRLSGMAEFAQVPTWITNITIESETSLLSNLLMTWVHFEQHLTHSWVVYFLDFKDRASDAELGWGRLHFWIPMRVLSAIVGDNLSYDAGLAGMHEGYFATEFTYLYYDFGILGPAVAALFGIFTTFVHAWTIRLPERWLPLHAMLAIAVGLCMMENQLIGGLGVFVIWGCGLYIVLHMVMSSLSVGRSTAAPEIPGVAV